MREKKPENVCDELLFAQLFRTHAKDLHDFLYYKFGTENLPQDLVQEAFVKLWNNCKKVPAGKARSFLFTVANNQMLNELSKKKTALKYAQQPRKLTTEESPEYVMQEKQFEQQLKTALEGLSEAQRVAFMMNRVEGKKHKEIAEMLGISTKAVEKRIYTALAKLRETIEGI